MNNFFSKSDLLDYTVLRPLSHIKANWELSWNFTGDEYEEEQNSYAKDLNNLIAELEKCKPPKKYHQNEDRLADYLIKSLKWPIYKKGNKWVGADYASILEQGGFKDFDQKELMLAAAGRIKAARNRNQGHFDDMEESHRRMLAAVLSIILYHRASN
jgi:hypothetical protein